MFDLTRRYFPLCILLPIYQSDFTGYVNHHSLTATNVTQGGDLKKETVSSAEDDDDDGQIVISRKTWLNKPQADDLKQRRASSAEDDKDDGEDTRLQIQLGKKKMNYSIMFFCFILKLVLISKLGRGVELLLK